MLIAFCAGWATFVFSLKLQTILHNWRGAYKENKITVFGNTLYNLISWGCSNSCRINKAITELSTLIAFLGCSGGKYFLRNEKTGLLFNNRDPKKFID